jgi:UDP-2,4-diacetamido-2,4,6-trideoxy-beta-L-altropyranose hydrolase
MDKSLFIRTDSSSSIGIGHIMRCIALAQAWQKRGGSIHFVSSFENSAIKQRIINENFRLHTIEKIHPDPGDFYCLREYIYSLLRTAKSQEIWLIVDGYHFDDNYRKLLKLEGWKILSIDDIASNSLYHANIVLNQNINAKQLKYQADPETLFLLGTRYTLLRTEYLKWSKWKRLIGENVNNILITLGGGSDPNNVTSIIIEALVRIKNEINLRIVVGPENKNNCSLRKKNENFNINIEFIVNTTDMASHIAWADVAISGGGSTCWEMAYMSLPFIVIILADNQEGIAMALHEQGVAINAGWYNSLEEQKLIKQIDYLMKDRSKRKKMSENGSKIVDGMGADRVIDLMIRNENRHYV